MKTLISLINSLIPCSYREDCISNYKKIHKTDTKFYEGCRRKHMLECAKYKNYESNKQKRFFHKAYKS